MSPPPLRMPAILLVVPTLLIAAGCGGNDGDETAAQPTEPTTTEAGGGGGKQAGAGRGRAVEVGMTEYSFGPSEITVSQGDTLEVSNDGEIVHNLTVEGAELATEDLDAGGSEKVTVDVSPRSYDFVCTIGNHAELGMTGTLTVE